MAVKIKVDGQVVAKTDSKGPKSHHVDNFNKEEHYSNTYRDLW